MTTTAHALRPATNLARWGGRMLSAPPALMLVLSSLLKLTHQPELVHNWGYKFGYPESLLIPVGLLELVCAVVYIVPRTAGLGCILASGFLAAAFATHVRVGDLGGGILPLLLAVLAWVGLYVRDPRVRSLVWLRGESGSTGPRV